MGYLVNPISFRLGKVYNWKGLWYKKYLLSKYNFINILIDKYFGGFFQHKIFLKNFIFYSHSQINFLKNNIEINLYISNFNILEFDKEEEEQEEDFQNISEEIKIFNLLQKIFNYSLYKILKKKVNVRIFLLNNKTLNPIIISRYIVNQLLQYNSLNEVIFPLINIFNNNQNINGYKIMCNGRFTKRQRASHTIYKEGKLNFSTVTSLLEYNYLPVTLKYGVGGVKVWILKNTVEKNYNLKIYY